MATFSRVGFRREISSLSFSVPGSSRSVLQLYDHRQACKCAVHIFIDVLMKHISNNIARYGKNRAQLKYEILLRSFPYSLYLLSPIIFLIVSNNYKYFNFFERRKIKYPFICDIKNTYTYNIKIFIKL